MNGGTEMDHPGNLENDGIPGSKPIKDCLCGGTFFTLLCQVGKPVSSNIVTFLGKNYAPTNGARLVALLRVLNPDFDVPNMKLYAAAASKFKNCENLSYGVNIPLNDSRFTIVFHDLLEKDYGKIQARMKAYMVAFLDVSNMEKMKWLAAAMIETGFGIQTGMYILPNGRKATIKEIMDADEINLPSLLLGLWDYIVMNVPDNRAGRETIRFWHSEKEEMHQKGKLRKFIGHRVHLSAAISMDAPELSEMPLGEKTADSPETGLKKEMPGDMPMDNPVSTQTADIPADEPEIELPGPIPHRSMPGQSVQYNYYYGGSNLIHPHIEHYHAGQESSLGLGLLELMRLDRRYYNLFIIGDDLLEGSAFEVPGDHALNECIRPEVKTRFVPLDEERIQAVKRLPSVFASPNSHGKATAPNHYAALGRVTDVRLRERMVCIHWKAYTMFPQRILNQNEGLFNLWKSYCSNELESEHWTIKEICLLDALQTSGFNPFGF